MDKTYHIETFGCQMNVADSRRLAEALELRGYRAAADAGQAGLLVLNTCVVRRKPEQKALARIHALQHIRLRDKDRRLAVMGCLVGTDGTASALHTQFPFVDFFMAPSDPGPLLAALDRLNGEAPDSTLLLPPTPVCAHVPAVLGCSFGCAYCIIPIRRGPERSRPMAEILDEARALTARGVREITLLGQIIDRYGRDLKPQATLSDLLRATASLPGLARVRFLTSHPRWMDEDLLRTVAGHDTLCPHLEIAVQAGSNAVLKRMRRGYTVEHFRELAGRVRTLLPDASLHTDIIVGFPGESDQDFAGTVALLEEIRFDMVHLAKYSPRPGTPAAEDYTDDVPAEEKERRRKLLEALQSRIQEEKNRALVGSRVEILVEGRQRGRWYGRTPQNRLVFFDAGNAASGSLQTVTIEAATAFSLSGRIVASTA